LRHAITASCRRLPAVWQTNETELARRTRNSERLLDMIE
jgi:hypothetical protein